MIITRFALDEKPLATDPPVSEAQRRAMYAAASGHSTLGIPKSVGEEFVGKDGEPLKQAAGIVYVAPDGDVLLLHRSKDEKNYAGHWGLPGGGAEDDETPEEAARRESKEELGVEPEGKTKLLHRRLTPNGMVFSTFAHPVEDKFVPKLNGEHSGYTWASLDMLPSPIHPSVKSVLSDQLGATADMAPEEWKTLRDNFAKWTREEEKEGEHAEDIKIVGDDSTWVNLTQDQYNKIEVGKTYRFGGRKGKVLEKSQGSGAKLATGWAFGGPMVYVKWIPDKAQDSMAMDRATVRTIDSDGRLHVELTPISKANICPYRGSEIPDAEALGLDPDKVYQLLRDPEELKKAAATFNNIQLMFQHIPVNAADPQQDIVVGTTGSDAVFEAPYLKNSLAVWVQEAIDAIESDEMKELSCAYRYCADMTPGTYMGSHYDGVMRDIVGNHVALVRAGRAGSDVVVGDSALTGEIVMSKTVLSRKGVYAAGILAGTLMPRLAADARLDLTPLFTGVSAKNFKEKKSGIETALKTALPQLLDKKFALDATMNDVHSLLDKIENHDVEEGADSDPNSGLPMTKEQMDAKRAGDRKAKDEERKKFLMDKGMSAEDVASYDAAYGEKAEDESEEEKKKEKEAADRKAKDGEKDEPKVTQKAMDAAIKVATETATKNALRTANEIAQAREFAQNWVGKLAFDAATPEDVYKVALDHLKVDVKDVHPSAFKRILELQPKPGDKTLALDARPAGNDAGFNSRWGEHANRVTVSG